MTKLETTKGGYYLWNYVPSIAAAVIFLLLSRHDRVDYMANVQDQNMVLPPICNRWLL